MIATTEIPDSRQRLNKSPLTLLLPPRKPPPWLDTSTGVGSSVINEIPQEISAELGTNLFRLHGCGTGQILDDVEAAAVISARLPGLARGNSGVGAELLERLCLMLNERLLPRIPAEGSVGASGDLTPLSYVAACLAGEREVSFRGEIMEASRALGELRIEPLRLSARDTLSMMNGTSNDLTSSTAREP